METALLWLDESISDCIMNMTHFNPKTNASIVGALVNQTAAHVYFDDRSSKSYDQVTHTLAGSVADLRMRTPLSCFGDCDLMVRIARKMVIPFGTDIPTKEFLRKYECKEIELWSHRQTEFPAYFILHFVGVLSFDQEMDTACFVPRTQLLSDDEIYFDWRLRSANKPGELESNSGPAITMKHNAVGVKMGYHVATDSFESIDVVRCMFCPHWPPEARKFCERSRPHGWPTRSTIEEIVRLGCDFVQASYMPCMEQNIKQPQWRISFSRAEIILIQTWSNSQKIVYHLLRYLNKNSRLFKEHLVCTYHLKTLMLWNCEKRSPEYWNCRRLMHIVSDMLSELKQCVQEKRLQNYFIPECNIAFKTRSRQRDNEDRENSECPPIDQSSSSKVGDLSDWFLRNYLFVVAARCPENESGKMVLDFQRTKANALINDSNWVQAFAQVLSSDYVLAEVLSADLNFSMIAVSHLYDSLKYLQSTCRYVFGMLQQADGRLISFFRASILLNAAHEIENSKKLPDRWLIGIILDMVIDFKEGDNNIWDFTGCDDHIETAASYFNVAMFTLQMTAARKESEANVLLLELAKCCFRKSLECSESLEMSSSTLVYLALISYKQRLYEEAMDLCVLAVECPCAREMHGINRDFLNTFRLPYLSATLGFSELLLQLYTEGTHSVKPATLEYPPVIVAVMLLKEILDGCASNVSMFERLKQKLKNLLENHDCRRQKITIYSRTIKNNSESGYSGTVTLHMILQHVKTFSNFQRKSQQKIEIYSRRSARQLPNFSDNLFNSLLDLSTAFLTTFRQSVREDLEPWKYCAITDQYMMLSSLRCGDYASALKISDQMIASYVQNNEKLTIALSIFHIIVSPPFHLLLDDRLKMLSSKARHNRKYFDVQIIDTKIAALYIKTECLLKLNKPVCYFCYPVHQLHLYVTAEAVEPFSLSVEIARCQLEKLLRILDGRLQLLPDGQITVHV